jgi:hypothetical protein
MALPLTVAPPVNGPGPGADSYRGANRALPLCLRVVHRIQRVGAAETNLVSRWRDMARGGGLAPFAFPGPAWKVFGRQKDCKG